MESEGNSKKITVVRWAWLVIFSFTAACFGSSWPHTHRLFSALYAAGFLAMGLHGFLRPVGLKQRSPGKPGALRVGILFLGLVGPALVLAGAWLQ